MGQREAKDALFDAFATLAKAMGNGHRAEIIDVLAQGALTTRCAFADASGHASVPAPSSQSGTFAIHRLRRTPLAEFERGELRFDAARLVPFTVRAK